MGPSTAAPRPGISAGSCPDLSAERLAELAARHGVDVVDLRAGKGQSWERDGIAPLRNAGVAVAFVGVSLTLGVPDASVTDCLLGLEKLGAVGVPVKTFVAEVVGRDPTATARAYAQARQILEAIGPGALLVETHHGGADPQALADLCRDTGARLLLDTYGLAQLGVDVGVADPGLRRHISAAQVKGYDAAASRHRPLGTMPGEHAAALIRLLPPGVPVLVESKAGSLDDDLVVLRRWLDGWRPRSDDRA